MNTPIGIDLIWINNFFKDFVDIKTRDIVKNVIIPKTLKKKEPYLNMIPEMYKSKANNFVSHAWDDIFESSNNEIGTIRQLADYKNICKIKIFGWIDIFCINQHKDNINIKKNYLIV